MLSALAVLALQVQAQTREFRLFYRFGFNEGRIGDPDGTPNRDDVAQLMCTTADFLTEELQKFTNNDKARVTTSDIDWGFDDWIYNGTEPEAPKNVPVIVNFTAMATTTDGSRLSPDFADTQDGTLNLLWEATKHFDYFSYIMEYVWQIDAPGNTENFFKPTRGMWYEPYRMDPAMRSNAMMASSPNCPDSNDPSEYPIDEL